MRPISLVPGLQGQFVFCSPAAGGCGNPTPVLIPISSTADISAILVGVQLSTGANVNAANLNVTGNTTMGGTLVVGGATTINNTLTATGNTNLGGLLNVTGNTSVGGTLTATGNTNLGGTLTVTGATQLGAPITLTAPITVAGNGTVVNFNGGSIFTVAPDPSNMQIASGTHVDGNGNYIADSTQAEFIDLYSNSIGMFFGTGLTIGQQWYPNGGGTPGRTQYFQVTNGGAALESGSLQVSAGEITATNNLNGANFVQAINPNAGGNAAAVLRASNGASTPHVTDVAIVGTSANLGGFFTQDRGYVASNAANGLLIESTGAGAGAQLYLAAPNGNKVVVLSGNHFGMANSGAYPSVSSCGSGAGVMAASTDNAGYVQTGSATSSCVITFTAGFVGGGTPVCVCTTQANTSCAGAASTSGFSMAFGTPIAGTWVAWICLGIG
jgi:hypothetical protein